MEDEGSDDIHLVYDEEGEELLKLEPTEAECDGADLGYPDLDLDDYKSVTLLEASTSTHLPVPEAPEFQVSVDIKRETEIDVFDDLTDKKLEPLLGSPCKNIVITDVYHIKDESDIKSEQNDSDDYMDNEENVERPSIEVIIASDEKLRATPVIILRDIRIPLLVPRNKLKQWRTTHPCVHCDMKFNTKNLLKKHITDVVCGVDQTKTKLVQPVLSFEVHSFINEKEQKKKENLMQDLCRRKSLIILEDIGRLSKDTVICQHCGDYFASKQELRDHLYYITFSNLLSNNNVSRIKRTSRKFNQRRRKMKMRGDNDCLKIKQQTCKAIRKTRCRKNEASKIKDANFCETRDKSDALCEPKKATRELSKNEKVKQKSVSADGADKNNVSIDTQSVLVNVESDNKVDAPIDITNEDAENFTESIVINDGIKQRVSKGVMNLIIGNIADIKETFNNKLTKTNIIKLGNASTYGKTGKVNPAKEFAPKKSKNFLLQLMNGEQLIF